MSDAISHFFYFLLGISRGRDLIVYVLTGIPYQEKYQETFSGFGVNRQLPPPLLRLKGS